eukprot:SAG11_NODE_13812_length_638_cov_0.862709_2_plen_26_part_01
MLFTRLCGSHVWHHLRYSGTANKISE